MSKVKFTKNELEDIKLIVSVGVTREQAEITILARRTMKSQKKQDKKTRPKVLKNVSKSSQNFLVEYNISLTPNKILNGAYNVVNNNPPIQVTTSMGEELTLKWIRSFNPKAAYHRRLIIKRVNDKLEENVIGINKSFDNNLQKVHTPDNICDDMVDLIDFSITTDIFYVFFSLEYVEALVYRKGVNPKQVKYFSDSISKSRVGTMLGVESFVLNVDEFLKGNNMPKSNNIVVIGNPPYNKNSNEKDSVPIYNNFIETIIDTIAPSKFSFIVPSRWMLGGKGLDQFRERMLNDFRFKKIVDFKTATNIFPGAEIAGGVNYFLWDKTHNGRCDYNGTKRMLNEHDIIIRDNLSVTIINKIISSKEPTFMGKVSSSKPYNIRTSEPTFEAKNVDNILCLITQKIGKKFVKIDNVTNKRNDICKWKVIVPIAPIAGQTNFENEISIFHTNNIFILPPDEICSETYLVINSFDSYEECENFKTYILTKFFRFVLLCRLDGQNVSQDCYRWVPDQLDYTKTYSDEELFEKYGLDEEEIAHINSKIKG